VNTSSIDLAAYLSVMGFEPTLIEWGVGRKRVFHYAYAKADDTLQLAMAVKSYAANVKVPVQQFVEARIRMKRASPTSALALHRRFTQDALKQVDEEPSS
jgi:hypothetical protein